MDESTAAGCRDKWLMRERIREAGIPCADVVLMDANTRAEDLISRLGLPLVVKQRAASGGRGTVLVREAEWVPFCLRPGWLAESFVDGVEMSLESWVHGGEILFANPTEYLVPGVANVVPADLRRDTLDAILRLNARALEALGVTRGMTHMELFLTDEGPVFGEIAARPPGGRIMQLVERVHGWDPWEAVIRLEAGEGVAPPGPARCVAGVWFLHPGPGRVRAIHGLQEVHDMPGLDVTLRVGPGDTVTPRLGTGQSVGCLEVEGPTHADVSLHLRAAAAALHIELE
jgi:biotin carboxylase